MKEHFVQQCTQSSLLVVLFCVFFCISELSLSFISCTFLCVLLRFGAVIKGHNP